MANKVNPGDVVPLREALNMEIIINQVLIDILAAKEIFTQEKLMAKIEEIRKEIRLLFLNWMSIFKASVGV